MTADATNTHPLVITRVGREGDGVADGPGGPIFIGDALPGEAYVANTNGSYTRTGSPSPSRAAPPCRHFGTCGGCVAQHMGADVYVAWKEDLIRGAFRTQGFDVTLAPMLMVPQHSRRRAAMSAFVTPAAVRLGFHGRRSHTLVDVAECPVLDSAIVAALPVLREIIRHVAGKAERGDAEFRVEIAALDGGLDVRIDGAGKQPTASAIANTGALARGTVARLTVEGLVVFSEREPTLGTLGGEIVPPPGAFFQAANVGEQRMASLVLVGVGKAKAVADLFCGVGTFTLPLATRARVLAVDNDKPALEALAKASRKARGLKPIEAKWRNLMGEPLSPMELAGIDAVALDPPRAGAKAQCEMLAKSKVGTIVMVSCNPATLARDCRILVDAGFAMGPVHGIDQFLWSPHVEAVVTLTRGR